MDRYINDIKPFVKGLLNIDLTQNRKNAIKTRLQNIFIDVPSRINIQTIINNNHSVRSTIIKPNMRKMIDDYLNTVSVIITSEELGYKTGISNVVVPDLLKLKVTNLNLQDTIRFWRLMTGIAPRVGGNVNIQNMKLELNRINFGFNTFRTIKKTRENIENKLASILNKINKKLEEEAKLFKKEDIYGPQEFDDGGI